jgi:hypothetical protein
MTESPKYTVLQKDRNIELRQYGAYIQAEADVSGHDYQSAISAGFNILAGYIFGNNVSRESIAMNTPVKVEQSQKIAMTTPVMVTGDGTYTVAFVMPAQFTMETLPLPKDGRVRFTPIPACQMAVITFSGYFRQSVIEKNRERLAEWLEDQSLAHDEEFIVAGYNPPWVPGFLARNEVMVRVTTLPTSSSITELD